MTQITIKHQLKKGEQQSTKWCNQQLTQNTSKQGTPLKWESQPPHMRIEPSSKCINQGSICFTPSNNRLANPPHGETVPRCNKTTQTHRGPGRSDSKANLDTSGRSRFFMHPRCMWSFLCTPHREACSASASATVLHRGFEKRLRGISWVRI